VAPSIAPAVPRGNERILVAEDDPSVRSTIARILGNAGYDVTTVEHGQAACDLATAEVFGLVILDRIMPRMSGPEAIDAIRSARPETRFVLSSGYPGDIRPHIPAMQPPVRFLAKPYDPDRLLRVVREVLDA
jgi:two-component system cell cycle sensor histidine kinase/response regulator CckA